MTKTNDGAELQEKIPDRLERLEILIDGSESLGVSGIRERVEDVEQIAKQNRILAIVLVFVWIANLFGIDAALNGLFAALAAIIGG